jgi:capsular polysaccharide export protein
LSTKGFEQTDAVAQQVYSTYLTSSRSGAIRWTPTWLKKLQIRLQYNALRRYFEAQPDSVALCWNGLDRKRLMFALAAKHAGVPVLFAELAPFSGFLQLDTRGINAASSLPRYASFYLDWARSTPEEPGWDAPLKNIVARAPRKAQITSSNQAQALPDGPYLFVPLQVQGDSQLRYFGGWIQDIPALIDAIDKAARFLPPGWHVRIKEHPSATLSFADQVLSTQSGRCYLSNEEDTFEQVKHSQGVVTVNSSVGLQAFAFNKPVCVLGNAFYGFEPLVNIAESQMKLDKIFFDPSALSFSKLDRLNFNRYLLQDRLLPFKLNDGCISEKFSNNFVGILNT